MDAQTFPVPLPKIMDNQNTGKDPLPVTIVGNEDSEQQENQKGMLGYLENLWGSTKKNSKFDGIRNKLTQAWDKVGIQKFAKGLAVGFKSLTTAIKGIGGGLWDMLLGLLVLTFIDPSGGFLSSIIGLFANLVVWLIGALARTIPQLIPVLLKIIPVLVEAFSKIIDSVIGLIPVIIEALVKGLPKLFEALSKAVVKIVPKLIQALVSVIKGIAKILPIIVKALIEVIPIIVTELIKALPEIISALSEALVIILNDLISKFPALKPILDYFNGIKKAITDLFDPSGGTLMERIGKFVLAIIDTLVTWISTGIPTLFLGLMNALKEGFPGMAKFIEFLENLVLVIYTVVKWIAIVVGAIMLAIKILAIIGFIIMNLPLFIIAALVLIGVAIYTYWDDIVDWISNAWKSFTDWLSAAIDIAVDYLIIGMRLLMLPFTWPIELGIILYKKFKANKEQIMKVLEGLFRFITDIWKQIKGVFSGNIGIGDAIKKIFSSALENIPGLNKIQEVFQKIANFFKGVINKIGGFLGLKNDSVQSEIGQQILGESAEKVDAKVKENVGNVIKNLVQSGSIRPEDYVKYGMSESQVKDLADGFKDALKEAKIDISSLKDSKGNIDMSKLESIMAQIAKNTKFRKSTDTIVSKTMKG